MRWLCQLDHGKAVFTRVCSPATAGGLANSAAITLQKGPLTPHIRLIIGV